MARGTPYYQARDFCHHTVEDKSMKKEVDVNSLNRFFSLIDFQIESIFESKGFFKLVSRGLVSRILPSAIKGGAQHTAVSSSAATIRTTSEVRCCLTHPFLF